MVKFITHHCCVVLVLFLYLQLCSNELLLISSFLYFSPSVSTVLTNPSSHFTPPSSGRVVSPVPSVLPLAPSLPSTHHSSPFSHHTSPAALHPAGPHVMFAPPLPTAGSLTSPSLPIATASAPAHFGTDPLLVPPSKSVCII